MPSIIIKKHLKNSLTPDIWIAMTLGVINFLTSLKRLGGGSEILNFFADVINKWPRMVFDCQTLPTILKRKFHSWKYKYNMACFTTPQFFIWRIMISTKIWKCPQYTSFQKSVNGKARMEHKLTLVPGNPSKWDITL